MSCIVIETSAPVAAPPVPSPISLQFFFDPVPAQEAVQRLASLQGPLDLYCWYEGPQGLPSSGAHFMKREIFSPLSARKSDVKLYLYSLKSWDFKRTVTQMPVTTPVGLKIDQIHTAFVECVYSSSFFRYCAEAQKGSPLSLLLAEKLPQKEALLKLSQTHKPLGTSIAEIFEHQTSLLDPIRELDVGYGYSAMQYVEGYYLIQRSIRLALDQGRERVEIAFLLPNDEGRYYLDYPQDLEAMLRADFGSALGNFEISLSFHFFRYGLSLSDRPYIERRKEVPKVRGEEIAHYFDYLSPTRTRDWRKFPFLRDVEHDINGWESDFKKDTE